MTSARQRGFTLIELIIFIVVVGAGLAGILSVSTNAIKSSADPLIRKQTIAIAESLLEEILLKDYTSPSGGTNVGTTCAAASGMRATWDNVCDYKGYTTTGIYDILGSLVTGSYNISPAVEVVLQAAGCSDLTGVAAKKVTVHVTGPQGTISLTGYRTCDLSPSCP